jgi:hypothetical protein
MMKKLLLVAGMMMLLATAVSADWPIPDCFPISCLSSSSTR